METTTARRPRAPLRQIPEADALDVSRQALDVANRALAAHSGLDAKLDQIINLLGTEQEDGQGGFIATGLLGRVRRVEATALNLVRKYQGWFQFAGGVGAATTILGAIIWFLTKAKITSIFGA